MMLETMHYGNGNNDGTYHRKASFSTSSDPTNSINYHRFNQQQQQQSSNKMPVNTTMTNGGANSNKINNNSTTTNGYYESSSAGRTNGSTGGATPATTKSPFERLVDNLRNNPEYKKEMALNRLIGFYRIGSEIGTGNFSQVRLGLHLLTREKVAVKILNKLKLDEKTQRLLLREISSMQKLHHPNIIRLYEVIHTQERLFICMEYASEGELYTKISNDGRISETHGRIIFSQVLSAVEHMHAHRIIHRDIKAENIFFACMDPYVVKVGDLGFSTEASADKYLNTYCGSPPYAAPELFRDDSYIGAYVDIWALGVLLYFIVTGLMPFKADTVSKLKRVILNGEYVIPSFVSDSCQLLIKGILRIAPSERFTIREIKDSAWLDHENQIQQLEAFQLNPTLDKSELKPEEIYTIKFLDKLGISKNFLIASNLPTIPLNGFNNNNDNSPNHPPLAHFHSHLNLVNGGSGSGVGTASASINTMMDNLITNKSTLNYLSSQAYNYQRASASMPAVPLTNDVKQSVNGTYRIVYHSVQKRLRNEWTSDENVDSFVNREFRAMYGAGAGDPTDSGHNWNGANMTLSSLQNHMQQNGTAVNNNNPYDERWTSFELADDESAHAFESRHPLSKAMNTTIKNFHRINVNGPPTAATTTTNQNGHGGGAYNMNREMVNLDSIDNDDDRENESIVSSNRNSNDSGGGGGGGAAAGVTVIPQSQQQPQQPTKSIFVRLNSKTNGEQSVQSAPGNGVIADHVSSSSSSPYANKYASNNNNNNNNNNNSSPGSHSQVTHRSSSHHPPLKSSKSVPKHIYSSVSQNGTGGASSSSGPSSHNGLTSKSHSNLANNNSGSSSKQQYSKLCSIL